MVNALKKDISQISDPMQLKLIQIIARYNIEPIHIPRSRNCHTDLLSRHQLLPALQLPPLIINALEVMPICHVDILNVISNLDVSVNTDIRLDFLEEQQQKDPVYHKNFEVVHAGSKLDTLGKLHPIQELKLDLSKLQIIKDRRLLAYQGKTYSPRNSRHTT